jgi:hypothetical protein
MLDFFFSNRARQTIVILVLLIGPRTRLLASVTWRQNATLLVAVVLVVAEHVNNSILWVQVDMLCLV